MAEKNKSIMTEIILKTPLNLATGKADKIVLDFDKITGRELLKIEKTARGLGVNIPAIIYSMDYQTLLAAEASGIKYDDLLDLSGSDYTNLLAQVNGFLFNMA